MKSKLQKAKKLKNIFMKTTAFLILGMLASMFIIVNIDIVALIAIPLTLAAASCITFALGSHYEQKERKLWNEYKNSLFKCDPEVTNYIIERTRENTREEFDKTPSEAMQDNNFDSIKYTNEEIAKHKMLMDNENNSTDTKILVTAPLKNENSSKPTSSSSQSDLER